MKNQTIIRNGQSFFDIAIETTGIASNALYIAQANNLTPTDSLTIGEILIIPDDLVSDAAIENYYTKNEIHPSTGLTQSEVDIIEGLQGVSYWVIGSNFKISEENKKKVIISPIKDFGDVVSK